MDSTFTITLKDFHVGYAPVAHLDSLTEMGQAGHASAMANADILTPGFLTQGPGLANLTAGTQAGAITELVTFIMDKAVSTDTTYGIGPTKLQQITSSAVTNTGSWPQTVTNMTDGESVIDLRGNLYYFFNKSSGGEIGKYDLNVTFDHDWGSTVPTGAAQLHDANHDYQQTPPRLHFKRHRTRRDRRLPRVSELGERLRVERLCYPRDFNFRSLQGGMKTLDLTPKFPLLSAEEEVYIPPSASDQPVQMVGGWRADAQQLSQGNVKFQAAAERILLGAATEPATGVGIFLGKDGSDYEFRAGNPSGQYIHWNGSTLAIVGTITATAGTIGGFDIGSDYIRDTANSMGLASTVSGSDDVRFWAGAAFADRATAPFRVTEAGAVVANNLTLTGGTVAMASASTSITAKTADTTRTISAASYTKYKEFLISVGGSYDVYFEIRNTTGSGTTSGQIFKNGVAVGVEQTDATGSFVAFNETISSLVPGDLIQFYGKKTIDNGEVRNFRLCAVLVPAATVNTD